MSSEIQVLIQRDFGNFCLDVDLVFPGQGVSILFGPSGCGKTTLLRAIAGLECDVTGYVSINGDVWLDSKTKHNVTTWRRSIGFVFQNAELFPHLRVRDNLSYGMNRSGELERTVSYDHIVDFLALGGLLERYPQNLSGGEKQRVAIARALLSQPKLLLMDEPLSSLDTNLKREILPYLETLHQELSVPLIYVTHAPEEVLRLADFVALMEHGRVITSGSLETMLPILGDRPGFGDEAGTVIPGMIEAHHVADGITEVLFDGGRLWIPLIDKAVGAIVRCRVCPSDVSLSIQRPELSSVLNVLPAIVEAISESASSGKVFVKLNVGGTVLFSYVTRKSARDLSIHIGQPLYVQIKATNLTQSTPGILS